MAADFWCIDCSKWTAPAIPEPDQDDLDWAREDLGAATPDSVIEEVANRRATERWHEQGGNPRCSVCGEAYVCDECGFEISTKGECQRPPDLGICPDSIIPAASS